MADEIDNTGKGELSPPPDCIQKYVAEYKSLTNEELIGILRNCVMVTMEQLLRVAGVVYVAASRDEDFCRSLPVFMRYAAMVAFGQILPEVALEFQDRRFMLGIMRRLPIHEQRSLMKAGSVAVAFLTEDGGHDYRCVSLKELKPKEARLAFGEDRPLSPEEQAVRLKAMATQVMRLPGLPPTVKIDTRHRQAIISGIAYTPRQIQAILAAMAA